VSLDEGESNAAAVGTLADAFGGRRVGGKCFDDGKSCPVLDVVVYLSRRRRLNSGKPCVCMIWEKLCRQLFLPLFHTGVPSLRNALLDPVHR
jgi:hypothetical protein